MAIAMKPLLLCFAFVSIAIADIGTDSQSIESLLLNQMNLSADPCNDFYNFACGGSDGNDIVNKEIDLLMRKSVERLVDPSYNGSLLQSTAVAKLVKYYEACTRNPVTDDDYNRYIRESIDEFKNTFTTYMNLFGDGYLFSFSRFSPPAIAEMLHYAYRWFNVEAFFKLEGVLHNGEYHLQVVGPRKSRPTTFDEKLYDCKNYGMLHHMFSDALWDMRAVMERFDVTRENISTIAKALLDFEFGLVGLGCYGNTTIKYHEETLDTVVVDINELKKYDYHIALGEYVERFLYLEPRDINGDLIDIKIIISPTNLFKFNNFIVAHDEELLHQYIYFKSIHSLLKNRPTKDCFDLLRPFPLIKSRMLFDSSKQDFDSVFTQMLQRIKETMTEVIMNMQWVYSERRQWVENKLTWFEYYISITEKMMSNDWLDPYFDELNLQNDYGRDNNYLDMHYKLLHFLSYKNKMRLLHSSVRPVDHPDNVLSSTYFKVLENVHHFRDSLFFIYNKSTESKYLIIAYYISGITRELANFFVSDLNYLDDKDMNKCVANLYNGFQILPGNYIQKQNHSYHTVIENKADILGLEIAYFTAEKISKKFETFSFQERELTNIQLLFVGYAWPFCGKQTNQEIVDGLAKGFMPNTARVLGIFRSVPEFAEAFQCPVFHSEYARERQCRDWIIPTLSPPNRD